MRQKVDIFVAAEAAAMVMGSWSSGDGVWGWNGSLFMQVVMNEVMVVVSVWGWWRDGGGEGGAW